MIFVCSRSGGHAAVPHTVNRDDNVATIQMTASMRLLTTVTSETFTVIDTAHRLFDLRNRRLY